MLKKGAVIISNPALKSLDETANIIWSRSVWMVLTCLIYLDFGVFHFFHLFLCSLLNSERNSLFWYLLPPEKVTVRHWNILNDDAYWIQLVKCWVHEKELLNCRALQPLKTRIVLICFMTLSNNYKNSCGRSTNVYYVHILLKLSGATCFDSEESSSGP